jgi:NAD(P)-dependent dehydrogenase (short-subunit alcohol dehydrogenase family)
MSTSEQRQNGVVVITGAAGGMGRAIAESYVCDEKTPPLLLCDVRSESLDQLKNDLSKLHRGKDQVKVTTLSGDVSSPDFLSELVLALDGREVAVLAHTAGVSPSMTDGWGVWSINFTATRAITETLKSHMAPGGVAVLLASYSGLLAANLIFDWILRRYILGSWVVIALIHFMVRRSSSLAYALSKRAVQLYVEFIAVDFGRQQSCRVVSLSPGIIATDMGRQEGAKHPIMGKMVLASCLARMGTPNDITGPFRFLASKQAGFITGVDLCVDGGGLAGINAVGGMRALMKNKVDREGKKND